MFSLVVPGAAILEGPRALDIPVYDDQNAIMKEGGGSAALANLCIRKKAWSVFRSYVRPYMDRRNLTVLSHALVTRMKFERRRADGVECIIDSCARIFNAVKEITPEGLALAGLHQAFNVGVYPAFAIACSNSLGAVVDSTFTRFWSSWTVICANSSISFTALVMRLAQ
jgi:choline dehydrogenase-like flavoprotein